jgi:hypothetical protein
MRRYRAPVDPHVDPLRAPSARGQHPHTHRLSDEDPNPQLMYERRVGPGVMYAPAPQRPMGAARQQQQQQQGGGFFDHPLVLFGLGAVAIAGAAYLMRQDAGRDAARDALLDEMLIRQNPSTPPPSSVVVVAPPGVPVTASNAPQKALPSADLAATAVALEGRADLSAVAEKKPEKKQKKGRVRVTTQARSKDGTFKKAGTRKKPKVEGKKTC